VTLPTLRELRRSKPDVLRRCRGTNEFEASRQALNAWFAEPDDDVRVGELASTLKRYGAIVCKHVDHVDGRHRRELVWRYLTLNTFGGVSLALHSYQSAATSFGTVLLLEVGRRAMAGRRRAEIPVIGRAPRINRFVLDDEASRDARAG
jgi:hypothetical protein